MAFEQGKFLPTPETVPFRLTRDMVDGMGLTGVEGVYRRCCEKTMEVMRTSQESLMTVVEVSLLIDRFRYIKIRLKTIDLSTRLWGITTEFVGLIPQSLVLRSIVLG